MQTSSLPVDHFNDVLARLPPGVDLTALAFETRAIERRREIGDGASLLRLALDPLISGASPYRFEARTPKT